MTTVTAAEFNRRPSRPQVTAYLLDTNVIGELRKPSCNRGVAEWTSGQSVHDLAISIVTIIEIETGILRVERRDRDRAAVLRWWFERAVLTGFAGRILPVDLVAARQVAVLHVPDRASQHDALIAGTALAQGMTVVTRNVADFQRSGVPTICPWV
ncbi:MAG: type II toxin-antitoxin system VapC family toxin [Aeromicrobium sp.]|uniref:type II toxin-antitoxin system VapC family toxin n=1 Tax=Aeromicrobium sp. TaxID=1871063 RepID=UPI0039E64844